MYQQVSTNIEETIGVPYELIRIDNSTNRYSICEAYNKGGQSAVYPYLCFVHEDVWFETKDWGKKVLAHFEADPEIGVVGIAGAVYKSKMSTAWWQSEEGWREIRRMNIVQHYKDKRPSKSMLINPYNEVRSSVVSLDGVFLATTKETWQRNNFDEKLLHKFHGYDLDFCLQVFQSKKVAVIYDVLLHHYSGGNSNGEWLVEILKVHKKWKSKLPLFTEDCQPQKDDIYTNGMKRLRKQMNILLSEGHSLPYLLKNYNEFFSFLDNKPGYRAQFKDYIGGLGKIIKLKYAGTTAGKQSV